MTAGIISAEGRDIGDGPYDRFLQIDAPINRGNSGGPTFNMKGEVVGVNTAIYSPSGGSVGIGFAIPATTVDSVIGALEHGGIVPRGYLGVNIQPVTADMAESLGMKTAKGAIVAEAMPGTPAAEAGLKAGDVITKLNGQVVDDASDLTRRIGSFKPSDKVELTYLRNGDEKMAQITLADQKNETVAKADASQAKDPGCARHPDRSGQGGRRRGRQGCRHRRRRSERNGRRAGTGDRQRHPRRQRQAGVDPRGREGRNREREEPGQEGSHDAHSDRRRRPLRGCPVPQGVIESYA